MLTLQLVLDLARFIKNILQITRLSSGKNHLGSSLCSSTDCPPQTLWLPSCNPFLVALPTEPELFCMADRAPGGGPAPGTNLHAPPTFPILIVLYAFHLWQFLPLSGDSTEPWLSITFPRESFLTSAAISTLEQVAAVLAVSPLRTHLNHSIDREHLKDSFFFIFVAQTVRNKCY